MSTDKCYSFVEKRCDDGNNGDCGKRACIQVEVGVNCSCNIYNSSDEDNMLARGRTFNGS